MVHSVSPSGTKDQAVKFGMVGGGEGAFIGDVHRLAARLDGHIDLVCGVFSRDIENSKRVGQRLGLDPSRIYPDYKTMMQAEAARPENDRMEFVSIVTPNHLHFPIAKAALEAGFSVLSDKPATLNLTEALELRNIATAHPALAYGLTHTYLGYPMVQEARAIVTDGGIGRVRKVFVEYLQGWLTIPVDNKQAAWRDDPSQAGPVGCMGDIGTHAHNLAEFVTGKTMTHLAADLSTFVEGRTLDDDGSVLFRMEDGIKGTLSASQICAGRENALSIRIFGDAGGLEWRQEEPNTLLRTYVDRPAEVLRSGHGYLSGGAQAGFRIPPGHPEGYIEAFANVYLDFANAVRERGGVTAGIDSAVRGMAFVEALVESTNAGSKWVEIAQ